MSNMMNCSAVWIGATHLYSAGHEDQLPVKRTTERKVLWPQTTPTPTLMQQDPLHNEINLIKLQKKFTTRLCTTMNLYIRGQ